MRVIRWLVAVCVAGVTLAAVGTSWSFASQVGGPMQAERVFPETGHRVGGLFLDY